MAEKILLDEYRKIRPRRQERFDPLFKILNKFTRDWVFGWKMRNRIYRFMGVQLAKDDSEIYISREVWIEDNFPELVKIDEGVGIGWRCVIFAHNTSTTPHIVSPVHLKKKVIIGHCVTIMPGVTVGEYAQIGCNALVTKDIEPYTVNVGVPAKPIREVSRDEIEMRRKRYGEQ